MKLIILDNAECFNGSKSMRICSTELLQHLLVCDFHRYVTFTGMRLPKVSYIFSRF